MRIPVAVGAVAALFAPSAFAADPLPEGNQGIAASYPGDAGIEGDADVLFADDFEDYGAPSELPNRWDAAVYQNDQIRLATEAGNVFAGQQALEFNVPQQDNELSNATDRTVSPPTDVLFLRYYSKFEPPFDVVGSSHNGAMISSQYFDDGQATPGVPADGSNKFLVNLENWRGEAAETSPGLLNVYVYHPEQRSDYGDHFLPSGTVLPNSSLPHDFGPDFVGREDITVEHDRWYCYEYMVQANTPGQRDGRIAIWLDGALVADFQNLRLRDTEALTIDRFGLSFHVASNPAGPTRKWYDNVVAATSYIGPFFDPEGGGSDTEGTGETGSNTTTAGSGDAGSSGDSASGGSDGTATMGDDSEGDDSGGDADDSGADEDDSGCGCRTRPTHLNPRFVGLALLVLVAAQRRRGAKPRTTRSTSP